MLAARDVDDPTGYGRVVRGRDGRVAGDRRAARRHARGAAPSTRSTPRIYCFRRDLLGPALRRLSPDNAQGEYYLTDVIARAATAPGYRSWTVVAVRRRARPRA